MNYIDYLNRKLFSGRISKKNFGNGFVLLLIGGWITSYFGLLYFLYVPVFIVLYFSLIVRRLQDLGHSGWWFFFPIPVLLLLYLLLGEGQSTTNKYGEKPSENIKFLDALLNR